MSDEEEDCHNMLLDAIIEIAMQMNSKSSRSNGTKSNEIFFVIVCGYLFCNQSFLFPGFFAVEQTRSDAGERRP